MDSDLSISNVSLARLLFIQNYSDFMLFIFNKGYDSSGKEDIAKQLKIIHLNGYSDEDRLEFRQIIFNKIYRDLKTLVIKAEDMNYEIDEENKEFSNELRNMTFGFDQLCTDENVSKKMDLLWKSDTIQKCFSSDKRDNSVDEYAAYFLDKLDTIRNKDYVPTIPDILRVRFKSYGIKDLRFAYKGFSFRMVELGITNFQTKKWIHFFQDVTTILFVASLADYERVLYEDDKSNRLEETIKMFDEIINNRYFQHTRVNLFLNKKDIFEERLKVSPLCKFFPEYQGPNEYRECVEFITRKFTSTNKSNERSVHYYETDATDTNNIKMVWNSVYEVSVRGSLVECTFI